MSTVRCAAPDARVRRTVLGRYDNCQWHTCPAPPMTTTSIGGEREREREREREIERDRPESVCVCVCVKVIRTKTCVLAHLKHSSSNRKRGTETNLTPSPGRPFSSSAHNLLIYLYNLFTHLHRRVVRLLLRPDLFLIQILGVKLPPMAEDAPWGRMGGRGVNMSVVGLGVKYVIYMC